MTADRELKEIEMQTDDIGRIVLVVLVALILAIIVSQLLASPAALITFLVVLLLGLFGPAVGR